MKGGFTRPKRILLVHLISRRSLKRRVKEDLQDVLFLHMLSFFQSISI